MLHLTQRLQWRSPAIVVLKTSKRLVAFCAKPWIWLKNIPWPPKLYRQIEPGKREEVDIVKKQNLERQPWF